MSKDSTLLMNSYGIGQYAKDMGNISKQQQKSKSN